MEGQGSAKVKLTGELVTEIVVGLPDGKSLTFWATDWEVREGHLTLTDDGHVAATFAPAIWTYCVGSPPLEWAWGIEPDPRSGA